MPLQAGALLARGRKLKAGAPAAPLPGQAEWFDDSNYTSLPSNDQFNCLLARFKGGISGLQNSVRTIYWKSGLMIRGMKRQYYVDLPGRDLSIAEDGSMIWLDVEPGCLDTRELFNLALFQIKADRPDLVPGIYGNRASISPVLGTDDLSGFPLWYADWRTPNPSSFRGFNGWTIKDVVLWQYSGTVQTCGLGLDLNVVLKESPVPVPAPNPVDFAILDSFRRLARSTRWISRPGKTPEFVNVAVLGPDGQAIEPGLEVEV